MNLKKIEEIAQNQMKNRQDFKGREPGWILYHGRRTGKIALHLADKLNIRVNQDILYIACLFHDIGQGKELHNEVGANLTCELLDGILTPSELAEISDIIRHHNQRKKSNNFSQSVKLVQDADIIDHVGLIDVWMAFYYSGAHGESIHDHITFFEGDDRMQHRNFRRKHLNFDISLKLLEERIKLSDDFFAKFHKVYFNRASQKSFFDIKECPTL
jgi:uncharacterized protein